MSCCDAEMRILNSVSYGGHRISKLCCCCLVYVRALVTVAIDTVAKQIIMHRSLMSWGILSTLVFCLRFCSQYDKHCCMNSYLNFDPTSSETVPVIVLRIIHYRPTATFRSGCAAISGKIVFRTIERIRINSTVYRGECRYSVQWVTNLNAHWARDIWRFNHSISKSS